MRILNFASVLLSLFVLLDSSHVWAGKCPSPEGEPRFSQSLGGGRQLILCGTGEKIKEEWQNAVGEIHLLDAKEQSLFSLSLPGAAATGEGAASPIDAGGDIRFDRAGFSLIRFVRLVDGERISATEETYGCEGRTCKRLGAGKCLLPERWPKPDLLAVREVRASMVPKQGLPTAEQLRAAFEAALGGNKEARLLFSDRAYGSVLGEKIASASEGISPETHERMGYWNKVLEAAGCWKKAKSKKKHRRKKRR